MLWTLDTRDARQFRYIVTESIFDANADILIDVLTLQYISDKSIFC